MERRVIVVGAGIAGLSAAYRIREQAKQRGVDLGQRPPQLGHRLLGQHAIVLVVPTGEAVAGAALEFVGLQRHTERLFDQEAQVQQVE